MWGAIGFTIYILIGTAFYLISAYLNSKQRPNDPQIKAYGRNPIVIILVILGWPALIAAAISRKTG